MTINVTATPMKLSWSDSTVVSHKIPDPNDGELIDAVTAFNYNIPRLPAKKVGSNFVMADPNTITITPIAKIFNGVDQTAQHQKVWSNRMKNCLDNPKSNQIAGFWV